MSRLAKRSPPARSRRSQRSSGTMRSVGKHTSEGGIVVCFLTPVSSDSRNSGNPGLRERQSPVAGSAERVAVGQPAVAGARLAPATPSLVEGLERYGGELLLRSAVCRILIKDRRVSGVMLGNGQRIQAPVVISNADAHQTFEELIGEENLPRRFVNALNRMTPSLSAFVMYLAIDLDLRHLDAHHEIFFYRSWSHDETYRQVADEGLWSMLQHGTPRWVQVVGAVPYSGPRVEVSIPNRFSAPGAAGVRVWQVTSRWWRSRTGRPPPEGGRVALAACALLWGGVCHYVERRPAGFILSALDAADNPTGYPTTGLKVEHGVVHGRES